MSLAQEKTTFAHLLWQHWKDGEQFNQCVCAILIHLRHPKIQEAQTISALLPYSDTEVANRIANAMTECAGKKIFCGF